MNREELAALRDAIGVMLAWPDTVRAEIARWLAPNDLADKSAPAQKDANETQGGEATAADKSAPKPNGRDHHSPPIATTEPASATISSRRSPPHAGKARPGAPPTSAKAADRKLIEAMRDNPGLTVAALATAVSAGRSATGARLRQLAERGVVTKDSAGHWRLEASPPAGGPEPRPPQPPG
jgi:hypothetical protein